MTFVNVFVCECYTVVGCVTPCRLVSATLHDVTPHNSVLDPFLYIEEKLVSIQAMKVCGEWRCTTTYLAVLRNT
jgi:hypothetical protein